MTQVSEAMTRGVRAIAPNEKIVAAAQAMEELNIGVLPVCEGDRLVGIVTDRDIVVRGVAQALELKDTTVSEVMSEDAIWCFEDQSLDEVQDRMSHAQIRRVPVVDREQHLVGMLSLADLAAKNTGSKVQETLNAISQPAEPDRSSQSKASGAAGGGAN